MGFAVNRPHSSLHGKQERNEQEGKVAAIKSLQQWRLTDVELHNFINRQVYRCVRHIE